MSLETLLIEVETDRPCVYCGLPSTGVDHVTPRAFLSQTQDVVVRLDQLTTKEVDCCSECNSLAGALVFKTLAEKRQHVKQALRKRYSKILRSPDWTEAEIAELGLDLQVHVRAGLAKKAEVRERLQW